MVAQLMIPFLKDGARAELQQLLGDNWQRDLVGRAASVEMELTRPKNKHLLPLQLTLFEFDDEGFDAERQCPNNACSVAAILESRLVLMQGNYTRFEKQTALTYLMHYMLQLHVPVNCGLKRDQGGQKIYLKDGDLKPVNLAWIWNHDLYRREQKRWFTFAQELYRRSKDLDVDAWAAPVSVGDWAFESHQIALESVYPQAVEGRYTAALRKAGQEVLETQLLKAAVRTAAVLNEIFPTTQ